MWFYIAFVVIAVLNAIINPFAMGTMHAGSGGEGAQMMNTPAAFLPDAIRGLFMALYGVAIVVIAVVTVVIIILRFFRNLLGDEGYLMMTLPVTREQHILAKLLAAVIWSVCTMVLIFLSLLLLLSNSGVFGEIVDGIKMWIAEGAPVGRWIAQIIILLVASCVTGILMLYAAMGMGPNLLKNRVGGSILAYIIVYVVNQFVMLGIIWGTMTSIVKDPQAVQAGMSTGQSVGGAPAWGVMPGTFINAIDTLALSLIIGIAAVGVGCWFLTRFMLKRKLNLA